MQIMSITIALLTMIFSGAYSFYDDNIYSDDSDDMTFIGNTEEWVDEALLDVAFYLRLHKFNEFDRRFYLKKDENSSYFYAQFPVPPLVTFHWEVYEKCSRNFLICLKYLQDVIAETHFQRSSSTEQVIRQMNWTWEKQETYIRMVNDECLRLKLLDWNSPKPFRGPLDRYRWRVTASYFMCWYTMKNITLLSRFVEPCDDIGECFQVEKLQDYRTDNSVPYQCALYSFCPDPCCPLRQVAIPETCQDVNPCKDTMVPNNCTFIRNENTWLPSIIYNEWNVSCICNIGYEWDSRYGMCIDINECSAYLDICNTKTECCLNLPGRYKCICRWGFMWSKDRRECVPDTAVKAAEIRKNTQLENLAATLLLEFKENLCIILEYSERCSSLIFGSYVPACAGAGAHWRMKVLSPPSPQNGERCGFSR